MIAASFLLIAGAITLLVMGLWQSSSGLLGASIAASVLAAVVLIVGARRMAVGAEVPTHDRPDADEDHHHPDGRYSDANPQEGHYLGGDGRDGYDRQDTQPIPVVPPERAAPVSPAQRVTAAIPVQQSAGAPAADDDPEADPPDEPAPQQVSPADAARVGQMLTEVLVVDGRPRYHLPGCVHLLGRENEPLPVGEAIELGFSPCSLCEPDSALLADARRV